MSKGYIYILQNPAFRSDLIKIGMTTRSVSERVKELSSNTSVPSPFEIACFFSVDDCNTIESKVHAVLDPYRWSKNREFFKLSLPEVYKIISDIILEYQQNIRVEQVTLGPETDKTVFSITNETNSQRALLDEKATKWIEKRRRNNAEERNNRGEEWVKDYLYRKNIRLPEIDTILSRTDISLDNKKKLGKLKSFIEDRLAKDDEFLLQRKDLKGMVERLSNQ